MKRAIIIGAGPAGLTAAYELLKHEGILPIILEETQDIGGISRTIAHHGNRMDLGGHRFFSKDASVRALWQEIMPLQGAPSLDDRLLAREVPLASNGPDPEREERVMLSRTRVSRILYLRKFFDYPVSVKPQTFINMGFVRSMRAGFSYLGACLHKRAENSLEDFYINRFGKALYKMFFEGYTEKVWGVHPRDIAPDWGSQRVKGLSLRKALVSVLASPFRKQSDQVETSLIDRFHYPKRGPGQLWEQMAAEIVRLGGEIHFGQRVVGLAGDGQHIAKVVTADAKGARIEHAADAVFSSMPIKDLVASLDGFSVPGEVAEVASTLPYRDFMTVGLLVPKLAIRNTTKQKTLGDIVPDCWIYIQERDVRIGRLQIFNNWSPYMLQDPQNTVWIGLEYFCNEGDAYWNMTDKAFIDFAIKELDHIGVIDGTQVRDSVRVRVKKAYPAYFGSYARMDAVRDYLDGIENLYCIGRNGQHRYNNMDHSMLTGMMAAQLLQTGRGDKSALWRINSEESYHERQSS